MKKQHWIGPIMVMALAAGIHHHQKLPENISRSVAQIEEDSTTAERIREVATLQSQIDAKVRERDQRQEEREAAETRLTTEALTEVEILELDDRAQELSEQIQVLNREIAELEERQSQQVVDLEAERAQILCENQQVTSRLETEIESLLADKEEVTQRVLSIASANDELSAEIDELRNIVSPSDDSEEKAKKEEGQTETQQVAAFDQNALLMAITSLAQSLQFTLGMQQNQMMGPMNFQPTANLFPHGQHQAQLNSSLFFSTPYNYYVSPYQTPQMPFSTLPGFGGGGVQQMQQQQAPQLQQQPTIIPMGSLQISSEAGFYTF